jgi:signal transduction histidine kinase
MNIVAIISAVLALMSALVGSDSMPYMFSLVALAGIFACTLVLNNMKGRTLATEYFVTFATTAWIVYMCIAFSGDLGQQNYLVIALVALAVFSGRKLYKTISIIVIIALAVLVNLYQRHYPPLFALPRAATLLFAVNVVTPLSIIALICLRVLRDVRGTQAIIEEQNRQLAESNQFKDRVFSIIGHDMRAPFNSARSLVELMEDDLLTAEERRIALKELRAGIDVSLQTLDNLLGWASQGYYGSVLKTKTLVKHIEVHSLVERNIQLFHHLATRKDIRFVNEIPTGVEIAADLEQLSFVLRNITSNAIKFSHAGQTITFKAWQDDKTVVVSIHDQGVGMTRDMISALFQITTRFSKEGTTKEKGTGLGLIFCKEFIESNNGKLWIESEPGRGTTVSFSLPKAV